MRVLIADNTMPVRSAIRRLLMEEKGFLIVGEVANLGDLMRQVRVTQPDLILLDWELSGLPGTTKPGAAFQPVLKQNKLRNVILSSLHHFQPQPKIIVLSGRPEAEANSLAAGADAFVLKGDPPEHLIRAIHLICD